MVNKFSLIVTTMYLKIFKFVLRIIKCNYSYWTVNSLSTNNLDWVRSHLFWDKRKLWKPRWGVGNFEFLKITVLNLFTFSG